MKNYLCYLEDSFDIKGRKNCDLLDEFCIAFHTILNVNFKVF